MDPIGGYFSLELPRLEEYHKDALGLNTGRNGLEYILIARGYRKVYLPFYVCEVILEPLRKLGVRYEFYHVDGRLEIKDPLSPDLDEAILYVNYFGLKQRYVESLAGKYGSRLIIDNTQAFYAKPVAGIDTFYSCRKFFGVPDGAYLYTEKHLDFSLEQDESYGRMGHLVKRIDLGAECGYEDFRLNDDRLSNQPIRLMSRLTRRLMQSVAYDSAARQRRRNYLRLNTALGSSNKMDLSLEEDAVPMVYPYLSDVPELREKLIADKVFVASYWSNVLGWTRHGDTEYVLASRMLPLPIDQRYSERDLDRVVKLVQSCN